MLLKKSSCVFLPASLSLRRLLLRLLSLRRMYPVYICMQHKEVVLKGQGGIVRRVHLPLDPIVRTFSA